MPRRLHTLLATTVCAAVLGGCALGQRPYFTDTPARVVGETTGDAAVDAVLSRLDAVTAGPVSARYDLLVKYGMTTGYAEVVLVPGRRSITIGNVHYIQTETEAATCTVDSTAPCAGGFNPQATSDWSISYDFYAADAAQRLRRDAMAKVGPSVAHDESIGGLPATCVDLPLPNGTAVYCVLDDGMLAMLDDGDVRVLLTSVTDAIDNTKFVVPAG